jgi:hypothetical protein
MEPEGSLLHSQTFTTSARSIQSVPPHLISWRSILLLPSHLRLDLPNGPSVSDHANKTLYASLLSPTRATCPVRLILLDMITRIICGEEYMWYSFSLCSVCYSTLKYAAYPNFHIHTYPSFTTTIYYVECATCETEIASLPSSQHYFLFVQLGKDCKHAWSGPLLQRAHTFHLHSTHLWRTVLKGLQHISKYIQHSKLMHILQETGTDRRERRLIRKLYFTVQQHAASQLVLHGPRPYL